MFCKSCGAPISQDAAFCSACGTPVERQPTYAEPTYTEPAYTAPGYNTTYSDPAYNNASYYGYNEPVSAPAPDNSILTFGILSLVLGEFGIPGIIFGAITNSKVNKFLAKGGVLSGAPKVGKILGKVGLILSIVMTVIWVIYFFAIIGMASSGGYYY